MVKYYPQICKNGLAGVAQLVEHLTRNEKVVSSILTTSSMEKDHREKPRAFPGDFYIASFACGSLFSQSFSVRIRLLTYGRFPDSTSS